MKPDYFLIEELLEFIDEPNRSACMKLLTEHRVLWEKSPGSTNNHQAWPGGYIDHITDAMNICLRQYLLLTSMRPLPFTLSDALLVVFLHDLEKPWKYERKADGQLHHTIEMQTKDQHQDLRVRKAAEYGIQLTEEHINGIKYAEGELNDYSSRKRVMSPLAALAHMCDVCSARIWFDHPIAENDPWKYSDRVRS